MKTKLVTLIFTLILLTAACKKEANRATYPINHQFSIILKTQFDWDNDFVQNTQRETFVIKTNSDWQTFMNQCDSGSYTYTNDFTETNIDFNNYMIIAVVDIMTSETITRPIEIAEVIENQNDITVKVDTTITGSTTMGEPNPFHIIKTDLINKPINFIFE